tara:strand:- start:75 stop:1031 length:957 start_codon:yes stop_codon:yes gene_type:complete
MNKNIIILVVSVVLLSFFNTTDTNFKAWNAPSLSNVNDYIEIPQTSISASPNGFSSLALVTNYFSKSDFLELYVDAEIDLDFSNNKDDSEIFDASTVYKGDKSKTKEDEEDYEDSVYSNSTENTKPLVSAAEQVKKELESAFLAEKQRIALEAAAEKQRIALEAAAELERIALEAAAEQQRIALEVAAEQERIALEASEKMIKDSLAFLLAEEERFAIEEQERVKQALVDAANQKLLDEEAKNKAIAKAKKDKILQEIAFKESIMKNESIKDNAKEFIIESLDSKILSQSDVTKLLNTYSDSKLKKKNVKQYIEDKIK